MTIKNYQMFWDCSNCGTQKLLGFSHRHCPNCGATQDETKRYFPSETEQVEVENHIYYGVDWDCQYCSTPNSNKSNNCVNCGASKDGTKDVELVDKKRVEIKKDNTKVKNAKVKSENTSFNAYTTTVENSKIKFSVSNAKSKSFMVLLGLILTMLIGFLIYGFLKVEDHTLTVAEKTWVRTVNIEKYSSVHENSWCSSMPYGAYNVSRYREVSSHRQVADGQICNTQRNDRGDGTYSSERVCENKYRSEPIYEDKCNYIVDRWVFSNSVLAQGNEKQEIKFPDVRQYTQRSGNFIGNTRESSRSESYKVIFSYYDKDIIMTQCTFKQEKWGTFNINGKYNGRVRMIGGLICDEF